MLGIWPLRGTTGPSAYIMMCQVRGPRSPHPVISRQCMGSILFMTMTGHSPLGALVRITSCDITRMLCFTCTPVELVGAVVSRAPRGAHLSHPKGSSGHSLWQPPLPAATELARLDQCYHWRRMNEKNGCAFPWQRRLSNLRSLF